MKRTELLLPVAFAQQPKDNLNDTENMSAKCSGTKCPPRRAEYATCPLARE
jgi:hypothetical protein